MMKFRIEHVVSTKYGIRHRGTIDSSDTQLRRDSPPNLDRMQTKSPFNFDVSIEESWFVRTNQIVRKK